MLKGLIWTLSLIGVLSFISCGGGSNDEGNILPQKVLHFMDIPQEVEINICQDSNNNDFCESVEIKAKATLNKGDSMATIWEKITQIAKGKYLLETATPCTPILLELEDSDVEYDDGQFTLKYSGIEFGETSKELSVLEAMVDGQYIPSYSVKSIKELNSTEAQNSLYATLYRDLKTNLNTLRAEGLTKTQAMRGVLKEMAEELLSYHVDSTLPNRLNGCNGDIGCINSEIDRLSAQLIIDNHETESIVNAQKDNHSPMKVKEVSCVENNKTELPVEEDTNTELLLYDSEFKYDEKNRLVKSPLHTYEYDSKGRHIRTLTLIEWNNNRYKQEYSYNGNRLKEIIEYKYNDESQKYVLIQKKIFSEWNNEDKPKKIKFIEYNDRSGEINEEGTLYIDYTEGNPTYAKGQLRHYSPLDAEDFGNVLSKDDIFDFEIRRTFDDKKLSFSKNSPLYYKHDLQSYLIRAFDNNIFRNNNILTEEIVVNIVEGYPHEKYFEKYNIRYDYTYNSQDMPIKEIKHTTLTTDRYGIEGTIEKDSQTYTYMYIEANKIGEL